jgi:hypothetical protein
MGKVQQNQDPLEGDLLKLISGALRSAIHSHGPITIDYVPSAAKRVKGQLKVYLKTMRKENSELKKQLEGLLPNE